MLIGKIDFFNTITEISLDNEKFSVSDSVLTEFAVNLNSPWSQMDEKYIIQYNAKDGYSEKNIGDLDWKCVCIVIGYDAIRTELYGYGNTQQEALNNCINLFKLLQEKYNPENESF